MDFDQWNLCRYLGSDLGTLALDQPEKFKLLADYATSTKISHSEIEFVKAYHQVSDPSWPKISTIKEYKNLYKKHFQLPNKLFMSQKQNSKHYPLNLDPFKLLMVAFKNGSDIQYKDAFRIIDLITSYSLKPNISIYNTMMKTCIKGSRWRRCLAFIKDMQKLFELLLLAKEKNLL
jgi:pentatricopeptide repeat protein